MGALIKFFFAKKNESPSAPADGPIIKEKEIAKAWNYKIKAQTYLSPFIIATLMFGISG